MTGRWKWQEKKPPGSKAPGVPSVPTHCACNRYVATWQKRGVSRTRKPRGLMPRGFCRYRRVFCALRTKSLLPSRNRYHSTHITRPEFGGRLPRAVKPNRGDLGSGDVSKTAERAVLLAVDIDGWIWLGLVPVEARFSPVAQEVRPQPLDYLVSVRRSRTLDVLLDEQLRLADVCWSESRRTTREENSGQRCR